MVPLDRQRLDHRHHAGAEGHRQHVPHLDHHDEIQIDLYKYRWADGGQEGIVPNLPLEAGMSWTVKARCTLGYSWPQSPGGTSVKCAELSALQCQRSVKL